MRCGGACRDSMHGAMKIIAVSTLTKNLITHHYGIDPGKVDVVYNAIETNGNGTFDEEKYKIHKDEKIVLFLGRITMTSATTATYASITTAIGFASQISFDGSQLVVADGGNQQMVRLNPSLSPSGRWRSITNRRVRTASRWAALYTAAGMQ